jgi:hypothetical protein
MQAERESRRTRAEERFTVSSIIETQLLLKKSVYFKLQKKFNQNGSWSLDQPELGTRDRG